MVLSACFRVPQIRCRVYGILYLVLDFVITITHFSPLGIHGLEARATLTGSCGTGFQPVNLQTSSMLPRRQDT